MYLADILITRIAKLIISLNMMLRNITSKNFYWIFRRFQIRKIDVFSILQYVGFG